MDLSDDIAYSVHDFEDAIVNGYLDPARLSDPAEHESLVSAIQAWVGYDFARDELADALFRLLRIPEWLPAFDGSRAALARLKNLTSDLIGRFARAATTATQEAYPGPVLTRYRAHVVVPRVIEAEMAVLKGIIGATVVSIEGRKQLYKEQRRVLKRLATALWETGPDALDAVFRGDFAEAGTDAARKRVIVDQVASLTDQLALAWHGRLVGEVDAASIGIWSPRGSVTEFRRAQRPASRGRVMAGRIRQADVEEVKARTNIADIVGERVALKTAGRGVAQGALPLPRRAKPELPRAAAGGLLPLLRLRRIRRCLLVPAGDGPRQLHRGRGAPRRPDRLQPALRGRRSRARDQRPHAAVRRERGRRRVLPRAARHTRGGHRPAVPRRARFRRRRRLPFRRRLRPQRLGRR